MQGYYITFKQCDLEVKVLHKLLPIDNDTYNAFYINYIIYIKIVRHNLSWSELQ